MKTKTVFISYSHQDRNWLERVRIHLKSLERTPQIKIWSDRKISAGSKWKDEIKTAIDAAGVAILIVSADFLASDFIVIKEIPALLKNAKDKGTRILPIIVSPSAFTSSIISEFQAINDPDKPLNGLPKAKREKILVRLAREVEKALKSIPVAIQSVENSKPQTIKAKKRYGKFEIRKVPGGSYFFHMKAPNGRIILTGKQYRRRSAIEKAIASIKRFVKNDNCFHRITPIGGPFSFVIRSSNITVLGNGNVYPTKSAMERGIKVVKKTATSAIAKDLI